MVGLVVSLVIGAFSKAPVSAQIDELSTLLCLPLPASYLGPLVLALAADRMLSSMEALAHVRIWRVGLQSGVVTAHLEPCSPSKLGLRPVFLMAENLV